MSSPDFKATSVQGFQAAQDLMSHRTDWQSFELDCSTDVLTLASLTAQGLLKNAGTPGPVLALDPTHKQAIIDGYTAAVEIQKKAEIAGSVLSETIKTFIANMEKWLRSMGWIK